ncbi:MAG: hypothetical protein RL742_817, partial [Bacteroidota bacterium]
NPVAYDFVVLERADAAETTSVTT